MSVAQDWPDTRLVQIAASDEDAFRHLVEPLRRELHAFCYRLLGSFHDAEDALQETLLRAWRGLGGFDGRASFRAWAYKIATNACLDALRGRQRRVVPQDIAPAVNGSGSLGEPNNEITWLEPYPDALLKESDPAAAVEMRDGVRLAFLRAIQLLPPRQRAVLILREVLDFPAADVASLLEMTTASVNSALQRARASVKRTAPEEAWWEEGPLPREDQDHAELLARFTTVWERGDIDGLVALLREDAVVSMPPYVEWFQGIDACRTFFKESAFEPNLEPHFKLVPVAANGQPAFAHYHVHDGVWDAPGILIVTIADGKISDLTRFGDDSLPEIFGLPAKPPGA